MISHKHRCVFIHIPKCGGQSVENLFLQENGLTWETREPLLLRANDDPRRGPPRLAHLTWCDYLDYGYADAAIMRDYTTFTVVRNPYKRAESLYRFLGYDTAISFDRFVSDVLAYQINEKGDLYWFLRPQNEYVCDSSGQISVDRIIKLEEIDVELPLLLKQVGVESSTIPHVNKSKRRGILQSARSRIKHARNGLCTLRLRVDNQVKWNDSTRQAVLSLYLKDFECFGYH